jgi:outer membrane protein TolC
MKRARRLVGYWVFGSLSVIFAANGQTPNPSLFGLNKPDTLALLDALQSTLFTNPSILIQQQQVAYQRGVLRQAAGQFDLGLSGTGTQSYSESPLPVYQVEVDELDYGIDSLTQNTNSTQVQASATKEFRNGISTGPELNVTRTRDNINSRNGLEQSSVSYQVQVPLFRGRGREAVDSQEIAARLNVQGSLYDLNQEIATQLAGAANAYWSDVAARDQLRVARDTEARGKTILEETRLLIEGDQEPRSDLYQVAANVAARVSTRIADEQSAIESHQKLALAMGLRQGDLSSLANPAEDLPAVSEIVLPAGDTVAIQTDISLALQQRADVLSARQQIEAARAALPAAKNALLPQLNAQVNVGYAGLKESPAFGSLFYPPFAGHHGIDAEGKLTFSFPPANNAARGQLEQASATVRQAQLKYEDTVRNVASGVITAVAGVRTASERLKSARDSVQRFQDALEAERAKHQLGVSPITNVLSVEDRLTSAQQTEVAARADYVQALVQLRLATGTIVSPNQAVQRVSAQIFSQIPNEVVLERAH